MTKKIVLAGGGHAHLETIAQLDKFLQKNYSVTVISPDKYHYYSGMAPGFLGEIYHEEDIRFDIQSMVEQKGCIFLNASLDYIDPQSKTIFMTDKKTINYDVISFNTGSIIKSIPVKDSSNIYYVKPITNFISLKNKIIGLSNDKSINISVIGGGAAGVEISTNIRALQKKTCKNDVFIHLFTGPSLLSGFNKKMQLIATKLLKQKQINIIPYIVDKIENNHVLTKANPLYSDIIILASGTKPQDLFVKSSLSTGPDGDLLVNKYLQNPDFPQIFGAGDCIHFMPSPLSKVGVYAVRQNSIILHNLLAFLEDKPLLAFETKKDYLQILNLGEKTGILIMKGYVFSGKAAFWLKNYIDRKFMQKYKKSNYYETK